MHGRRRVLWGRGKKLRPAVDMAAGFCYLAAL
jgi:hypothetical protein